MVLAGLVGFSLLVSPREIVREKRSIEGWTVQINVKLFEQDRAGTEKSIGLLTDQLKTIKRLVPSAAVKKLQLVPLWVSPDYAGVQPAAAYHPGAQWLKENGRDPIMVHGVEFYNVRIFELEVKRMPFFVLHELAHSYHDLVLGFDNKRIEASYQHAKASGKYDSVLRWLGTKFADKAEKAYAMTNPQEYFAEGTEAYFGRNDFYPFDRKELKEVDPELFDILADVWNAK